MSAPRGTKTKLAFGLVECDITLYKTTDAEKPPTWEKAGPGGHEILPPEAPTVGAGAPPLRADALSTEPAAAMKQIADDEKAHQAAEEDPIVGTEAETGKTVRKSEVRRGQRREDGTFADLTAGLAEIDETTKLEEMRIADFIATEQVKRDRVIGSYYVAPSGPGAGKVMRLLYEAMHVERKVAVVKWTKRSKQSLGVLVPVPAARGLMVVELAWADDVRAMPEQCLVTQNVEVTQDEIKVALELVRAMHSTKGASLDVQVDDARGLRAELIDRVERGEKFAVPERPVVEAGGDVIDLMERGLRDRDALERAAA